ncbi:MAG: NAD(P)-binding domain-containing protein [Kofleriaceae bacterium]|nr:NAD(P)-binding domain-containing protein [Kofleriaceae bacterium]
MRVAIIGSGHVGGELARAWAARGHDVVLGARDPGDPAVVARAASLGAGVATAASALDAVVAALGALRGTIVVDCTNAIAPGPAPRVGHTTSSAEELARRLPGARVVKAFNTQGAEILRRPVIDGVAAAGFYCGDDDDARRVVAGLIADVGLEPVDVGPLRNARLLEPLMLLWVATSRAVGSRGVALTLLRR